MPPKSALASRLSAKEKHQSKRIKRRGEDDFDDEGFHDDDMMANLTSSDDIGFSSSPLQKSERQSATAITALSSKRKSSSFLPLQRRGPLSEALSSGKYAARPRGGEDDGDAEFDDDASLGCDFDDDQGDDEAEFPTSSKRGSKKAAKTESSSSSFAKSKKRGRAVGFAHPENEEDIEAKLEDVDDIFGILDVPSDDEDLIAGAEDEDEIAERIELRKRDPTMRSRKLRRVDGDAGDANNKDVIPFEDADDEARQMERAKDEDADILQQIADLRKRQAEEKFGVAIDEGAVGAAEQLRQAASLLGSTFNALLRLRLKLQPAVSNALQLPQYYSLGEFVGSENNNDSRKNKPTVSSSSICAAPYSALRREMTSTLTQALDAVAGGHSDRILRFEGAGGADSGRIDIDASYENYVRLVDQPARKRIDATIEAIGKRVVLGPNEQKNKSDKIAELPLLDQIKGVMTGLTRLFNRAQKNRAHTPIFGHPLHGLDEDVTAARKKLIAAGNADDEIFDDSDFARELIQRSTPASDNTRQQQTELLQSLKQASSNKVSRKGFSRKTKGRSINYDPRPKLVGFMVPIPCVQEQHQREALFKNIFADA